MKKLLPLIIFIFAFTTFAQQKNIIVTAIKANIRETPSAQSKVVGSVKQNDLLPVFANEGEWYYITLGQVRGWIHYSTVRVATESDLPKPSNLRYKKPQPVTQEQEIKIQVLNLSSDEDKGYDIVKATKSVYLYSSPDGTQIGTVTPYTLLILLERNHTKGWLNVIHVESGLTGWVYYKDSKVYFSQNPKKSESVFEAKRTESDGPPEIKIANDTNRLLTVKLGDKIYKIDPYKSQTIYLSSGTYKLHAFVPNAYPLIGEERFSSGYEYTWSFYIVTK